MPNLVNVVDWLTMESLRRLTNKLEIASMFNTDESSAYKQKFPVGETIRVKLPQRFIPKDGIAYQPQAIARKYTTITVNQWVQVGFDWDSVDAALKMERTLPQIFEQYFAPGMDTIAQEIDSRAAQFAYQNTNHVAGVLGTTPTTVNPFFDARRLIIENAGDTGPMCAAIAPKVNSTIGPVLTSLFRPGDEIDTVFKKGYLGQLSGAKWYESMSLYSHTAGTWASAVTVSGANQSGSTLTIIGTSGDTINKSDVISIAGVYEVNPQTRRSTGTLKEFVVTQAATLTGGADTIYIQPALIGPSVSGDLDQYQNVDSLPASGAALTLFPGTATPNGLSGTQNLIFTRDAFMMVGVELEEPKATEFSSQKRDPDSGIAVRITRTWDPILSRIINRIDCLFGFGLGYPDNCAVRLLSA